MGKKSKTKVVYPEFSGGNISVNGRDVATTTKNNGVISTNYNMSDTEGKIYNSIQKNLNSSLGDLFKISDPQRKEWENTINTMKEEGISNINSIYTPMENNLKNDIAARFGNLDNSTFMDNLNSIVNKRAKAVADLSNNLTLAQNSLYSNEIGNRMNIIGMLSNLNTAMNNNIVNYMNAARNNSSAGNTYNNTYYQANNANNSNYDILGTATNALQKIGGSLMSFI